MAAGFIDLLGPGLGLSGQTYVEPWGAISGELAALRARARATMRDTCRIGTRSAPSGHDPSEVTWTWGDETVCGLVVTTRAEASGGSQATITDAVLRLPWGASVRNVDRVRVTRIGGEPVLSIYYAVDGEPTGALANKVVRLRRLTGESAL